MNAIVIFFYEVQEAIFIANWGIMFDKSPWLSSLCEDSSNKKTELSSSYLPKEIIPYEKNHCHPFVIHKGTIYALKWWENCFICYININFI